MSEIIPVIFEGAEQFSSPTLPFAPGTLGADVLFVQRIQDDGVLSIADASSSFERRVTSSGVLQQAETDLSGQLFMAVLRIPGSRLDNESVG